MYALRNLGYLKVSNFIKISDAPFAGAARDRALREGAL